MVLFTRVLLFYFFQDSQYSILSGLNSWDHLLCLPVIFLQADLQVPAGNTRVPLQCVQQDESKGMRSYFRCWLPAALHPTKDFFTNKRTAHHPSGTGAFPGTFTPELGRGAGAAVGKLLKSGKQSPRPCLWACSQFSCFWRS